MRLLILELFLAFASSATAPVPRVKTFNMPVKNACTAVINAVGRTLEGLTVEGCIVEFKTERTFTDGAFVRLFWTARCRVQADGRVSIELQVKANANASKRVLSHEKDEVIRALWTRIGENLTSKQNEVPFERPHH
jgi:hypothetical protein